MWQAKYMVQRLLSLLPAGVGHWCNHELSVRFGNLRSPTFNALNDVLVMVNDLATIGFGISSTRVVELGTGWDGAAAMCLLGLGAERVDSYDLYSHLDSTLIEKAMTALATGNITRRRRGEEHKLRAIAAKVDRSRIDAARFHYHAPVNAGETGIATDVVDLYFSLAVLEHVRREALHRLLSESFRILKPRGICYHYIEPAMHAWQNKADTAIDFLAFEDVHWKLLYENDIAHENRLRAPEYLAVLRQVGFDVVQSWSVVDPVALSAIPNMRIARRFQRFTDEELATTYLWVVARKPA
ncbi:MAG: methyltransferase domain-containing protein [Terriglobales bacterium]